MNQWVRIARISPTIHGSQAVAPLKPHPEGRPDQLQRPIHGSQAVAPLKHPPRLAVVVEVDTYPRLPSRGPIEACEMAASASLLCGYPRLPSRGPIEAGTVRSPQCGACLPIHGSQAVAPLKPAPPAGTASSGTRVPVSRPWSRPEDTPDSGYPLGLKCVAGGPRMQVPAFGVRRTHSLGTKEIPVAAPNTQRRIRRRMGPGATGRLEGNCERALPLSARC